MKSVLSLIFVFLTFNVFADTVKTRISKVIKSDDGNHPHLLLLENGTVAKVSANEKSLDMLDLVNPDEKVELTLDDDRNLISILSLGEETLFDSAEPRTQKEDY